LFDGSGEEGEESSRTNLDRRRLTTDVENGGFRAENKGEDGP